MSAFVDGILDNGGSVADATTTGVGNGFPALAVCSGIAIVVALVLRSPTRTPQAGPPPA
ncbi:hypothetical protein OTB20_35585 [Streptomyces sp. H27-H1]|uniref:hypothetical protein n=1 Tax=Streptomyces sp. H27-H1 TaxID=2996461 RepID=UPI0022705A20|nr:hypothetical protein [Streptomyces sp. H27-H1]MCY0931415.1 hypothetical protein [Streptomyces sp. H27-H1]